MRSIRQRPILISLNASTGAITANAAIVPAGANGDVAVFVTDNTDLVIDVDGYFGPPASGGLSFHTLLPCRLVDTRNPPGSAPFKGEQDFNVYNMGCAAPLTAQAYVVNATVVPPQPLDYLTLWASGTSQPLVSTLNASDAAITSNMAIVPVNNDFMASFVPQPSHLVLDVSGYFAP